MLTVNITVPVFNEESRLIAAIATAQRFLAGSHGFEAEIVIADNGSTDNTLTLARQLERGDPRVRAAHLEEKGRGRALKAVWSESKADIVSYMDVDLSTDLNCFPALIEPLIRGRADIAIGSRLLRSSLTTRGFKREFISRGYNLLVKAMFRTRFSDAQCGFKALTREAARELLPLVKDNGWFMDTELLLLAERRGSRIFDLPVRWVDNADSRVKIWRTAFEDLKGLFRMKKAEWRMQKSEGREQRSAEVRSPKSEISPEGGGRWGR